MVLGGVAIVCNLPALRDLDDGLNRRTLGQGSLNLADHIGIVDTDDGLDARTRVTVNNVVLGQHVGCRYHYGTQLVQGQHHHPPFVAAFQNEHHGVALANAERHQV